MSEYIDNLIAEALGQVHGQSSRRRYSVAEVKQIVYPLIGALRDPAALESVQRPFPVDGAPMGGDPAVVVRGAVQSDVATSAPILATSPEHGKPVAVQPGWAQADTWRVEVAFEGAVQPVTPDQEEAKRLSEYIRREIAQSPSTVYVTLSSQQALDAAVLLASGVLGQPQPQPDRDTLVDMLRSSQHAPMETHDPHTGECVVCPVPLHALSPEEIADALLPLLGQPRTAWVVEDREALAKALCSVDMQGKNRSLDEVVAPGRELWMRYLPEADALLATGALTARADVERLHRYELGIPAPRTDVIAETIREFEDLYFGPGVQTRTWVANAMRQRHGLPPRDAEPRTDAPLDLDPRPMRSLDGRKWPVSTERNVQFDPDPGFEQDQARYPRTDTTEPGDKP